MFRPNVTGLLHRLTGTDLYMRESFAAPVKCPAAAVNLKVKTDKTSVRADSSASRGQADEVISDARVLIVAYMKPANGDKFEFDGVSYKIVSTHVRRTVAGKVDHYECDLEILP
jgi:hypothetical protein